MNERLGKDDLGLERFETAAETQVEDLANKIRSRELMIELLDDEYRADCDVLYEWTQNLSLIHI